MSAHRSNFLTFQRRDVPSYDSKTLYGISVRHGDLRGLQECNTRGIALLAQLQNMIKYDILSITLEIKKFQFLF